MKKKRIFMMFLILFLTFIGRVNAEEVDRTCNAVSKNELRQIASNIKITYEEGKTMETYFDGEAQAELTQEVDALFIKIYNMSSKLYITYETSGSGVENKERKPLTLNDVGSDGAITLKQMPLQEMVTYTFKIASDAYGCGNETIRTIKLTLPLYNSYSNFSICTDIPEYYLCKKFVTFKPKDYAEFMDKVNAYKETLAEQREEEEGDGDDFISETISSVSKYKYVVVGVIVAIGVVITVLILRRKRSDK